MLFIFNTSVNYTSVAAYDFVFLHRCLLCAVLWAITTTNYTKKLLYKIGPFQHSQNKLFFERLVKKHLYKYFYGCPNIQNNDT